MSLIKRLLDPGPLERTHLSYLYLFCVKVFERSADVALGLKLYGPCQASVKQHRSFPTIKWLRCVCEVSVFMWNSSIFYFFLLSHFFYVLDAVGFLDRETNSSTRQKRRLNDDRCFYRKSKIIDDRGKVPKVDRQ